MLCSHEHANLVWHGLAWFASSNFFVWTEEYRTVPNQTDLVKQTRLLAYARFGSVLFTMCKQKNHATPKFAYASWADLALSFHWQSRLKNVSSVLHYFPSHLRRLLVCLRASCKQTHFLLVMFYTRAFTIKATQKRVYFNFYEAMHNICNYYFVMCT